MGAGGTIGSGVDRGRRLKRLSGGADFGALRLDWELGIVSAGFTFTPGRRERERCALAHRAQNALTLALNI